VTIATVKIEEATEREKMTNRVYLSNKEATKFSFKQSPETFKVVENTLVKPQKRGEFRLLEVTKTSISTIELIEYIASVLKIKEKEISYAGLKDKHAVTTQYLTLPRNISVKKFKNSDRVNIKEIGFCDKPIKVGELRSNSFEIVLEDVSQDEYYKIERAFNAIKKNGFANFFGYQRFGVLDDASLKGKKISEFGKGSKNQKSRIIVAAYQAKYFNEWLNKRLEISKNIIDGKKDNITSSISPTLLKLINKSSTPFKLLPGDLGFSYKKGKKIFETVNNIEKYIELFDNKKFYPTGVLFGSSVRFSTSIAGKIEREFVDYDFDALRGARRAAWVSPQQTDISFNKKNNTATLKFTLPAGSYATVLLEELLNDKLV